MSKSRFQYLAGTFAYLFQTERRTDGTEYTKLLPNAEEWMADAVRKAHASRLPDDTIYALCARAAEWIAENYEDAEAARQNGSYFADAQVDIYHSDRLAWLAQSVAHMDYVDTAVMEMGHSMDGMSGDIGLGQFWQAHGVYFDILFAIGAEAEKQ